MNISAEMDTLDGTPLPELPPRLHNSPSILGAYPQILKLERSEQATYSCNPSAERGKKLIYTRILGYLILEGPSDEARVAVALEVNACSGDEVKLLAIGQLYFDHFIRACKLRIFPVFFTILKRSSTVRMYKGRTPTPSSHASRPSFETRKAMIMAMVVEALQNHQQAKANVSVTYVIPTVYKYLFKALVRDGFRCVISGLYDVTSVERNKELELELERAANADVCATECAHIFPESTNANTSGSSDKVYSFLLS